MNDIVFSAIFDLYCPKIREAASNNTFVESHKRALKFEFTLQILDALNFYHKDSALKHTAKWPTFPCLLISIQHDSWRYFITRYLQLVFPKIVVCWSILPIEYRQAKKEL